MIHPHSVGRLAVALALLSTPFAAQRSAQVGPSPLPVLEDTGARGYALLDFGPVAARTFERAAQHGGLTTLTDFALPGGDAVQLLLRPVEVWEAGGAAQVVGADGEVTTLAPSVRLFSASVPGRASSGFLGVSARMLHGYLELEGERYVLSTGPGAGRPLAIAHQDALPTFGDGAFCNVLSDVGTGGAGTGEGDLELDNTGKPKLRATKVFLECDKRFRDLFATTQDVIDYATLLVAATSEIYRRDLGVTLSIPNGYLRVWESRPPWGNTSTFGDLSKFINWWTSGANSQKNVGRAQVHLISSPVFGGVANGIGVTCSQQNSFAISSCNGSFPYPIQHTSSGNWDLIVFAHETGHLYGSEHTFDYTPPIQCDDGSGPDKGTIMSYCHQTYGTVGIGLRFHARVQDKMRMDIASKLCPQVQNLKRGDYTADGVVDEADLAVFDVVDVQGFASRAAREVFDMDQDGDMDATDRVILHGKVYFAKASATPFSGSGVNCPWCYIAQTTPIIGQTFTATVGSYVGDPILTVILGGTGQLNPPVALPYGELLVAIKGFGGTTVFQSNVMTNGQYADHNLPIPFDPSFVGLTVETQAALFKPTGIELTTGLSLYVSTY